MGQNVIWSEMQILLNIEYISYLQVNTCLKLFTGTHETLLLATCGDLQTSN